MKSTFQILVHGIGTKKLTEGIGFEPVDCGPLKAARYLELMAVLIMKPGYGLERGTGIGFKLVKA